MARYNLCPNPNAGVDLTGYSAQTGTISRLTAQTGASRTTAARLTSNAANAQLVRPSVVASPGQVWTVQALIRANTTRQVYSTVQWFNTSNAYMSQVGTSVNLTSGVWTLVQATAVTAPASTGFISWRVSDSGGASGTTVDSTMVCMELSSTLSSFFDGNTTGAVWDGTAESSTSTFPDAVFNNMFPFFVSA